MKIKSLFRYMDERPGMPLALSYTLAASWLVLEISHVLQPVGPAMTLVIGFYLLSVFMVTSIGWMFSAFICGLEDSDDAFLDVLGFYSWQILYELKDGTVVPGHIRMTKDQAMAWASEANAFGIRKTKGPFKRVVLLRKSA